MKKIPEIPLILKPENDEAKSAVGFKWAAENIGKRSKLGGNPDWLQGEDSPMCDCGNRMTFYAQIDSIGDDICIADCGMVYIFICFDCFASKSIIQSQ